MAIKQVNYAAGTRFTVAVVAGRTRFAPADIANPQFEGETVEDSWTMDTPVGQDVNVFLIDEDFTYFETGTSTLFVEVVCELIGGRPIRRPQ